MHLINQEKAFYIRNQSLAACFQILMGIWSLAAHRLEYHGLTLYVYPRWAEALGWLVTSSSLLMIPLWMVITIARQPQRGLRAVSNETIFRFFF